MDVIQNKKNKFKMGGSRKFDQHDPVRAIISGGFTGAVEISITYPTEYVKTKMQLYKEYSKKGLKYCIQDTYSRYGVSGFYRGLAPLLVFSVPKVAVRFGTNDFLRNRVFNEKTRLNTFFAGLGAGTAEAIAVVTPAETIKVKLIHDRLGEKPKFKGMFDGIKQIVAASGWSGIYKGLIPTIIKQGSNQGIRFLVFEDTKHLINKTIDLPEPVVLLTSGAVAGAASVFANNPIDVVKTQMQGLKASQYNGTIDCIKKKWSSEGIRGFYKGTVPRLCKVCADVALTFTVYEETSRLLDFIWPPKKSLQH